MSDFELIRVDSVTWVSRQKPKAEAHEAAVVKEAAEEEVVEEAPKPKHAKKKG